MSLAPVCDRKDIRLKKSQQQSPSWNVLSLHSTSFTAVPSPDSEGHGGMVLKRKYAEAESRRKLANSGSPGRMAGKPVYVYVCVNLLYTVSQ